MDLFPHTMYKKHLFWVDNLHLHSIGISFADLALALTCQTTVASSCHLSPYTALLPNSQSTLILCTIKATGDVWGAAYANALA